MNTKPSTARQRRISLRRKLLAVAIAHVLVQPVQAALITVNSTADTTADDGVCTLREAVVSANTDTTSGATTGECAAGTAVDFIEFASALYGDTVTVASQITISAPLTISAPEETITINASGTSRIFDIDDGSATAQEVTLELLTLSGAGTSNINGGAIRNRENLTVNRSTLSGNTAYYGGAIENVNGTLTVNRSTFSGNTASLDGGAILNRNGTTRLTNSTLSGNLANRYGGALRNADAPATLTLVNSTLAGNSAGTSGGGLFNQTEANLTNTIIADSVAGDDCRGTLATNINNLIETGTCAGAITNDPQLQPLANNGHQTQTHALVVGSPALNAGDQAACTSAGITGDQRGVVRDAVCDIGAFELQIGESGLVVNTLADTVNATDAQCSLREAIISANTDTDSGLVGGECSGSFDTITFTFAPSVVGTLTLTSGQMIISSALTIQGPGADQLTIDAAGASRHFYVSDGSATAIDVTIDALTLSNGSSSAGFGGAIYNRENLTVTNSTLSGNTAITGGAIDSSGDLTLDNSTLSGNRASGNGGAISNLFGELDLTNSTLSGNTAGLSGGGIINIYGTLTIDNVTLTDNVGAMFADDLFWFDASAGSVSLRNSILGSTAGNFNCQVNGGNLTQNLNNLIADGTCDTGAVGLLTGDPLLGPLRDNAGPTLTHALLPSSPATNAGDNASCLAADQRGLVRNDGLCDIGAFEVGPAIVVNTHFDDVVSDDAFCSLREAVTAANTDSSSGTTAGECAAGFGPDIISFDPALSLPLPTSYLSAGEMTISSSLTIQGPGADNFILDAGGASRHFLVTGGFGGAVIDVSIDALTLTNGEYYFGGAIFNFVNLTVTNSTLSGNTALTGGAIESTGNLTVHNSTLSGNRATSGQGGGGAISSGFGGTANLSNSTLSGNRAFFDGGAIRNYFGELNLANSTLSGNTAGNSGGGVYNAEGVLTIDNVTLTDNVGATSADDLFWLDATAGSVSVRNSILGSTAGNFNCQVNGGNLTQNLNNLIADGTCDTGAVGLLMGDPLLGPLQDNGGPTLTHAVLSGSPVIDAGDQTQCASAGVTTDQTGMPRPIDGNADGTETCDIGAVEFVDIFGPQVTLASAPDVAIAGGTSYDLDITYTDVDAQIEFSSIGVDDILVTGPGILTVDNFSTVTGTDFTYTLIPPGGDWDYTDNGEYTIALNANQVFDTAVPDPNAAAAGVLGTFNVAVAEFAVRGNDLEIEDGDTTPSLSDGTDFGAVVVGETVTRDFFVGNLGEDVITISSIEVSGNFSVTVDPTGALGSSSQSLLQISFSPTVTGLSIGTVTINNDDFDESEYTFAIVGNGALANTAPMVDDASFAVSPSASNGAVVGQVSATDAENNIPATGAWQITAGNDAGAYAIGDDGSITVANAAALANATLTVQVTDMGGLSDTATITITVLGEVIFSDGFE